MRHATTALLFLIACTGAEGSGSNDIDDVAPLTLTEERRIGSVDDPETGFSRIGSVDVDRDGNVYALEVQDREIRVYDPEGRMVRRIGRRGAGPDEFEDAPRFGLRGDTVWTYQMSNGRITLFDRTGNVIGSGRSTGVRVPTYNGWGSVMPERMNDDGLLVGWFLRISFSRNDTTGVEKGDPIPVPRVLFDVNGNVVDTMSIMSGPPPRMVPPPEFAEPEMQWVTHNGERHLVPRPPSELADWMPADDGHYVVDVPYRSTPGTFTVTRFDANGDTAWHRVLTYTPEPYTEEQLMATAGRPTVYLAGAPPPVLEEALVNQIRARLDFPPYCPPIERAWLANDGAVWLLRFGAPGGSTWVVLGPDGTVRGEVRLPDRARPMWSRGDTVWASVPDELDVPWLVRYRVGE